VLVALEEILDLHERQLIAGVPVDTFERTRAAIRHSIETESWNETLSTYTSEPGKSDVDASLLCLASPVLPRPAATACSSRTGEFAHDSCA